MSGRILQYIYECLKCGETGLSIDFVCECCRKRDEKSFEYPKDLKIAIARLANLYTLDISKESINLIEDIVNKLNLCSDQLYEIIVQPGFHDERK